MIDTHNKVITFGKYEGERWTRLPVGYLRYLANEHKGESKRLAESELARRGTTMDGDVEISGHAIDRASQITEEWKQSGKGIHSWLYDLAAVAYAMTEKSEGDEKIEHGGYLFVFKHNNYYPVLKTVMRANCRRKRS